MHRRINVCLPEETIDLIDRLAGKGRRSRFIDASVKHFVRSKGRRSLRKQLEEGYAAWGHDDRQLAEEWFPLEEEAAGDGRR